MILLGVDTETTGLPEGRNPSILETEKWPYIVQISWILYDTDVCQVLNMQDHIVDCGVPISEESVRIHGISKSRSERKGIPLVTALDLFDADLQQADVAVAHNISFDKRICMVEAIRHKRKQYFTREGIRKPDVRIFQKLLENWRMSSERAVMIGDTLRADVLGAKNAGMRSIWLTEAAESPENRTDAGSIVPEATAVKLTEVPTLIRRLNGKVPIA